MRHFTNILDSYFAHNNKRLLSLDVFRGLTLAAMILVNNPGSWSYVYAPLAHAKWHGITPTDLIFPFFIFIVGFSIFASKQQFLFPQSQTNKSMAPEQLWLGFKRSTVLFALGIFLALFYTKIGDPNYSWVHDRLFELRYMGVLQRIAVVYLFTLAIVLYCRPTTQYLLAVMLCLIYLIGIFFVPYADESGQLYQGELNQGFTFADYLDSKILGPSHMYLSDLRPFASDPEGIFSTLPAMLTCLSGVWTAKWIKSRELTPTLCAKLLALGVTLVIIGHSLSSFVPINKQLWTPTYVLVSSGWAILLLAVLLYVLELKKYQRWSSPFVVFGVNSIAFFMIAGILARLMIMFPSSETSFKGFLFSQVLQTVLGNYLGSLAFAILFLLFSYLIMHQMYRKRIFWKV